MPPVKHADPVSCLFLFFLTLFIITGIIIFSPVILVLIFVLLILAAYGYYVLFARERLMRTREKFRDSAFGRRYSRTRETRREEEDADPDVVDVGFTVLNEDDPEKTGRSR